MPQAIYKVPNGKLLKLFLETADNRIKTLKITGDFFLYPEEAITLLEEGLLGAPLEEAELGERLQRVIDQNKVELYGVDVASIVKTILMAD